MRFCAFVCSSWVLSIHDNCRNMILKLQPKKNLRKVMASRLEAATPLSRETLEDTEKRGGVVRASLPRTSLALKASVQLSADFFLRISCRSLNNDSRARPPPRRRRPIVTEIWKLHHSSTGPFVFSWLSFKWDH